MNWIPVEYTREVEYKKNGGQLTDIEVAEEQSVIPEGALHKELHHLNIDGITKKGVPVVTINGEADTLEEIKAVEDTITQHAEVEASEVIFSKELTDYIEEARKEWHETNSNDILEEVGKRVTKELLFNTDDRVGMIDALQ